MDINRIVFKPSHQVTGVLLVFSALLSFNNLFAQDKITTSIRSSYHYDSNLFRLADEGEAYQRLGSSAMSDTIRQIGGSFSAQIPVSQQLLNVDANFQDVKFDRFNYLDYTGGNAELDWDWRYATHWNGDFALNYSRTQPNYEELQVVERDIRTKNGGHFNLHYDPSPGIRARAAVIWYDSEHSAELQKTLNRQARIVEAEIRYLTSAQTYLGTRFTFSDVSYPEREYEQGFLIDNGFSDSSVNLTLRVKATRKSILEGWAGFTSRSYSNLRTKNVDGYTGNFKHVWLVTDKVKLTSSVWRDFDPVDDGYSNQIIKDGLNIVPMWLITEKISLQGLARYEMRDYTNIDTSKATSRKDNTYAVGASLNYGMYRFLQFGVSFRSENRRSTVDQWKYRYNYAMLNLVISI